MESEKLAGFSEDGDHRNPEKTEEGSRCKRWYECVFCKRGFTNAQALGGHMNIHRKHRSSSAKSSSSSSKKLLNPNPNPNPSVTRFITGPFPFETSSTDSWEALRNKLSYTIHGNDHTYPILVSSSSNYKLGSDLTLQIGSSHPLEDVALNSDDDEEEEEERDQDIDLELRLGRAHHP